MRGATPTPADARATRAARAGRGCGVTGGGGRRVGGSGAVAPLVDERVVETHELEALRDLPERLGVAEEEPAAGREPVGDALHERDHLVAPEVDEHVAAHH